MNIELYKVATSDKYTTLNELFESVEIMDEQGLRAFFIEQLPQIDKQVLKDHGINPDTDPTELFVELCDIMDILNGNDTYNDNTTHYYVEQVELTYHE